MANYVLVCVGGTHPSDADEAARVAQAWVERLTHLGSVVIDRGTPFGPALTLAPDGTSTKGAPSGLTGYTVFTAESLAAAAEIAQRCPHLGSFGTTGIPGTVEIYEALQM
jgi:hypothetical protein